MSHTTTHPATTSHTTTHPCSHITHHNHPTYEPLLVGGEGSGDEGGDMMLGQWMAGTMDHYYLLHHYQYLILDVW